MSAVGADWLADATSAGARPVVPAWLEATDGRPCPVCGADHDCAVDVDDPELVLCCRVDSAVPAPGGWVHVVGRPH